jgi:hypothetical protein
MYEELSAELVVRDVLCCSSREHVDFTIEVLRQAFLLPFSHAAAVRRVIALYKDWIQMNVSILPNLTAGWSSGLGPHYEKWGFCDEQLHLFTIHGCLYILLSI